MSKACERCEMVGCSFHCMMKQRDEALAELSKLREQYPEGKLSSDDEGELTIAVGVDRGNVVLSFGKPVKWLGMGRSLALALAATIINKANTLPADP